MMCNYRMVLFGSVMLVLLIGCGSVFVEKPKEISESIKVTFCHFEVPEMVERGSATFHVSFQFLVGQDGKVLDIIRSNLRFIEFEAVESCLRTWRFPAEMAGESLSIVQRWVHGVGWESMTLVGLAYPLEFRSSGNPCPYRKRDCQSLRTVESEINLCPVRFEGFSEADVFSNWNVTPGPLHNTEPGGVP